MTQYLLVSFKTCPWVQRAAIVLREKQIPFEFRHIDPDNRPDWFLAMSPHRKVPVLRIDDQISLFESNAIAEYLDETIAPRLHPADPIRRAINRAWTDYLPSFASAVTASGYAAAEAEYQLAVENVKQPLARLEKALETQDAGPFFNGAAYSLVDAAYAPFLQRAWFLERVKPLGLIAQHPRLAAWQQALLARPSTHSFPQDEFEALYRENLRRRGTYVTRFLPEGRAAA